MMPKENVNELRKRNIEIEKKLYTKNNIFDEIRTANELIQMYEFIYNTKSSLKKCKKNIKNNSILQLQKVSNLPTDLILYIRDFIPYEIRVSLMQDQFNIYSCIKKYCYDINIIKYIIESPNFHKYFHSHPIYNLMYDRTTLINGNYYYTNNQNYLYTYLRFKTLFLLFKNT
jgi:hypothetical protein